jgi:uncharacterized membrane protein YkgB
MPRGTLRPTARGSIIVAPRLSARSPDAFASCAHPSGPGAHSLRVARLAPADRVRPTSNSVFLDMTSRFTEGFNRRDARITAWMARHGVTFLRLSLGIVFFWFGVLKFLPGLSPAQDLAAHTILLLSFGLVGPSVSVPVLAAWECAIGLGLLHGGYLRSTLLLLWLQMLGTLTPLVLFPSETFTRFPYAPTLEGQYIIKNLVLISAAIVVGATVRGGRLMSESSAIPAGEPIRAARQ